MSHDSTVLPALEETLGEQSSRERERWTFKGKGHSRKVGKRGRLVRIKDVVETVLQSGPSRPQAEEEETVGTLC